MSASDAYRRVGALVVSCALVVGASVWRADHEARTSAPSAHEARPSAPSAHEARP